MALQVWLPLNGNLDNQGLSNVTVTNNGATVDNNGKIGPCYRFQTNSNYITLNKKCCDLFKDGDSFSYCCWIKIIAYSTSSSGSGTGGTVKYLTETSTVNGSTVKGGGFGILINTAGTATGYANPFSGSFSVGFGIISLNTWTHLTLTYNKSTKILSSYVNGNFISKSTASSNWGSNGVNFIFGRGSQGGWTNTSDNYQNDIRIYDHCLSAKEVHEIAKGLVLHYPLHSNNISLSTNLITGFVNGGQTTISGNNIIISGNNSDTYFKIKTSKTLILNKQYKLSCIGTGFSNDSYYNFPIGGQTNTSPGLLKIKNGYCELIFIANDVIVNNGTTIMLDDTGRSASAGTITNIILQEYTDIIYDYSGYQHHANVIGTLNINNSPRYNNCIKNIDEYPCKTTTSIDFPESSGLTICCWVNLITWGSQTSGLWATSNFSGNSTDYDTTTCHHRDSRFDMRGTNGTTYSLTCNVNDIPLNTWKYVTVTHDGANAKFYINGILIRTKEIPSSLVAFKYIYLGYSMAGGVVRKCQGSWSDFRIYATALSEEDILELYNTSALIDNKGNLFGYQFNENISSQVYKNGIFETNYFLEPAEYIYLPAGTYINTGLHYENGDICRAETIIKYDSGGSGRDLMGFSSSAAAYWGVTSTGIWEKANSYTDADITKKNTIVYEYTAVSSTSGNYQIGALTSSYSLRNKYIYRVRLYKNGVLERDLYPMKTDIKIGLYDILHNEYYLANNTSGSLNYNIIEANVYNKKIESNQLIEI